MCFRKSAAQGTGGGVEPLKDIDRPLDFRSEITAG
jgi:hypothetical protein